MAKRNCVLCGQEPAEAICRNHLTDPSEISPQSTVDHLTILTTAFELLGIKHEVKQTKERITVVVSGDPLFLAGQHWTEFKFLDDGQFDRMNCH